MATAQRTNRRLAVAAVAIALMASVAIGTRAIVAYAFGGPLDAAEAIPREVAGVLVADLAKLRGIGDAELVDYSMQLAEEAGELPAGAAGDDFWDVVEEELGIDVEADLFSWIGRSAALGFSGDLAEPEPESVIAAISVRDEAAAWRFVDLVVERTLEEVPDAVSAETTVEGLRVVILDSGEDPAHFGVNGDHLVIADSRTSLETAYATLRSGESVLDEDWFQDANSGLGRGPWMKVMLDPAFINDALGEAAAVLGEETLPETNELVAVGVGFGMTGDELRMEAYIEQAEPVAGNAVGPLPLERLADLNHSPDIFFGLELPEDVGRQIVAEMEGADPALLSEMVALSEESLGIDAINDGLAHLGRYFMFSFAVGDDTPVGYIEAAVGLTDPAAVIELIEAVRAELVRNEVTVGGRDGVLRLPEADVVAGVLGDELVLKVDPGHPVVPFVETEGYEWLEETFPEGVFMYIDLGSMLASDVAALGDDAMRDVEQLRMAATFEADDRSVRVSGVMQIDIERSTEAALGR